MGHIAVSDVRAEWSLYIIFGLDVDGTYTQKATAEAIECK